VTLAGTGIAPLTGISATTLTFGNQTDGTTSASQPIILNNTGGAALTINSIAASANFGETNNCGSSLAANSSCTINVTFTPAAAGTLNGTLTITDNNGGVAGSTQTASLTGTGIMAGAWAPGYQFLAAGSSAQFNTTALAALDPNANNLGGGRTACTEGNASQHWANTSGMAIHDPRGNPNISDETGSVWIGWDSDFITGMDYDMGINGVTIPPTGPGIICAYVSLDSVVGMREYFANGQFVLSATANAPDASNATVPGLPAGVNLPPEVVYFFNKLGPQVMNVAPTDIRPEDGKFATVRALTTQGVQMPGPPYAGLGYGPGPVGTAIKSNYPGSSKVMQVADFVIYPGDLDPISTLPPRSYSVSTVGAAPVLVIANTTQTGAGHLGNASYNQINKPVLADIFSGQTHEVRDIGNLGSSDPINTLTVFQREPLSDTYNVFDFSVTCAYDRFGSYGGPDYYRCQETNVNAATMNPLNLTYTISNGQTASRQRVIGTGEMAQAVCGPYNSTYPNGYPDSIGYISWGFANFKGINTNCKYLPVDSIDPLYAYLDANPSGVGAIPSCTWTQGAIGCPALPFTKIVDGGYPIWTMYRWVWAPGPYEYVGGVLPYVELVASSGYLTDFVPTANMLVFHQHYDQCVTDACQAQYGSNGVDATSLLGSTCGPSGNLACIEAEVGGDMGGKVLTINSEIDYTADHVKNGATSGCTTGAGGNWPDAGSPGVCEQTTIDLGNHRLPPW
jgi:hypothetical protein